MLSTGACRDRIQGVLGHSVAMTDLDDERCSVPVHSAWPIAVLARARRYFRVPRTSILVLPHRSLPAAVPAAPAVAACLDGAITVRAWLTDPAGEAVPMGPSWYNLNCAGTQEAVIELAAIAGRRESASRFDRLVMTFQQFVDAHASARVRVGSKAGEVTLRTCWGLDEYLETVFDHDQLVLSLPGLDVRSHVVAPKPTAVRAAGGGTRMVAVPVERRRDASVDREFGRDLAARCLRLTQYHGRDAEFDIAISGDTAFLLTCRPVAGP